MIRMRRGAIVVALLLVAACGGGDGGASEATGSGSQASVGDASAADQDTTDAADGSSTMATSAASGSTSPGATPPSSAAATAGSGDAPVPPGDAPFPGEYPTRVTGVATLNGRVTDIDMERTTLIEDLSDGEQRVTIPGTEPQGDQVDTRRYSPDEVELTSMEFTGINKRWEGPVLYSRLPVVVGDTWTWSMTSTDDLTTLEQHSRVDRIEDVVIGGQTVATYVIETDITLSGDADATGHLTSWAAPTYKLVVKSHTVFSGTSAVFSFESDTTNELVDLRPQ